MSKKIPKQIYQSLTISQRVRAAWEAKTREDTAELKKLTNPSEAGEYVIDRVSAVINDLEVVEMAARLDAMAALVSLQSAIIDLRQTAAVEEAETLAEHLNTLAGQVASISKALEELATRIGLPQKSLSQGLNSFHPILRNLVENCADRSSPELVEEYCAELFNFLGSRHPGIACFHPA